MPGRIVEVVHVYIQVRAPTGKPLSASSTLSWERQLDIIIVLKVQVPMDGKGALCGVGGNERESGSNGSPGKSSTSSVHTCVR